MYLELEYHICFIRFPSAVRGKKYERSELHRHNQARHVT